MTQLKKALERSDKYIEELEAQVSKSQREGAKTAEDSHSKGSVSGGPQAGGRTAQYFVCSSYIWVHLVLWWPISALQLLLLDIFPNYLDIYS